MVAICYGSVIRYDVSPAFIIPITNSVSRFFPLEIWLAWSFRYSGYLYHMYHRSVKTICMCPLSNHIIGIGPNEPLHKYLKFQLLHRTIFDMSTRYALIHNHRSTEFWSYTGFRRSTRHYHTLSFPIKSSFSSIPHPIIKIRCKIADLFCFIGMEWYFSSGLLIDPFVYYTIISSSIQWMVRLKHVSYTHFFLISPGCCG